MVFSVAQINEYVRKSLQRDPILSQVEVRGEISNLKFHQSGLLFFTLKDEQAALSCMMFQADALRLRSRPFEGMRATVTGSISLYVKSGQYRLTAKAIRADGLGVLYERLQILTEKLSREGLFAQERKKPLPEYIDTLGVVTSPTGAVIHDIINVSMRRNPHTQLLLCPVRVQGSGAAEEIAAAIDLMDTIDRVSVIIVVRGGGSIEDLWAFNEEMVARACARCHKPIVSAIGHETDNTLCDLASDVRAPTPSAAAELAVPRLDVHLAQVEQYRQMLTREMREKIAKEQHRLSVATARLRLLNPREKMRERHALLTREKQNLERAIRLRIEKEKGMLGLRFTTLRQQYPGKRIADARWRLAQRTVQMRREIHRRIRTEQDRVAHQERELQLLSPYAVLGRGYVIVENTEGRPVASAGELETGQEVRMLFADGEAGASILSVTRRGE